MTWERACGKVHRGLRAIAVETVYIVVACMVVTLCAVWNFIFDRVAGKEK